MDTSIYSRPDKELLDWELSLESSDLRSHAWYHGNIPRNLAELLLEESGEFLVRDSSTFSTTGDYVLSTKWNSSILHFLIHKEVMQPNTIYEQFGYRFENESFTTVQDLITNYVGNKDPISARSGAIISFPRTRVIPISRKDRIQQLSEFSLEHADYASVSHDDDGSRQVLPVEALLIERSFQPEGMYHQHQVNLKDPDSLLEELEDIPVHIRNLEEYKKCVSFQSATKINGKSNFDLSTFSSILLPMNLEEVTMNPTLIEQINSRILEVSNRCMAYNLTCVDIQILKQEPILPQDASPEEEQTETNIQTAPTNRLHGVYENILNDTEFRWNGIIDRSLTFSHFVAVSVLGAQEREEMLNKWIGIADELKIFVGNYFSFCNIMRGLTCTKISAMDGPVDWMKLRRMFTNSAFLFETTLRNSYHNLLQGIESYPPNTTIPNLLPVSLIFEGIMNSEFSPSSLKDCTEEDKLKMTVAHLRLFYNFCENEDSYNRNWERIQKDSNILPDIILAEACRTETQLLILWGVKQYNSMTLLERCMHFNDDI